jgi:peptide/nickel transport system substrate-binding protein
VDKLLADARVLTNEAQRKEKYFKFQEIITDDLPMIFIYSPDYIYVQSKKIKGFDVKNIFVPSDRFANEEEWYVNTKNKLNIGLK